MLLLLHGRVLRYPFISDDYIFLYETREGRPESLLLAFNVVQNYYRPLGRELFFFVGRIVLGTDPFLFRLVNLGLLLGIIGLTMGLGWRLGGLRAGILAGATYALLYPHRVLLTWVSCSQDLLAAGLALGAAHLWLSERRTWSAAVYFCALFAKESVAPLPLVVLAFEAWRAAAATASGRRGGAAPFAALRAGIARTLPLWVAAVAWVLVVVVVRVARDAWVPAGAGLPVADVMLEPASLLEGFRLTMLSFIGLDQPLPALREAAAGAGLPILAMLAAVALAGVAALVPRRGGADRAVLVLGAAWAIAGALPVALVGHHFSAYYITFAGAGFALVAGALLARIHAVAPAVAFAALAYANVVANDTNTYRIHAQQDTPKGVSYVTFSRLEWEVRFLRGLKAALDEHTPGRGGEIFLSHAPRYLGFATAGDRAPRVWFDDSLLTLNYISHYRPEARGRPRVVLRFDEKRWAFTHLPDAMVDAMVTGEEALSRNEAVPARAALERALALARPGEHDIERAELSNTLGVACDLAGDTPAARQAWQQALAITPGHREATLNLASLEAREGRYPAARVLLVAQLRRNPADAEAQLLLTRVEFEGARDGRSQAPGRTESARRLSPAGSAVQP